MVPEARVADEGAIAVVNGIVWNEKTLDRWLAGPEELIPGQKMGVSVSEAKDRADLIEYLKEESRR